MSASDYLENEILDHIFNNNAWTAPTNLYVALCSDAPIDADNGTTITQVDYTGYARVSTTNADWDAAADGVVDNSSPLVFGQCTVGSDTATHFAICDAADGGNLLFHGVLDTPLSISPGVQPQFPVGDLQITCD